MKWSKRFADKRVGQMARSNGTVFLDLSGAANSRAFLKIMGTKLPDSGSKMFFSFLIMSVLNGFH